VAVNPFWLVAGLVIYELSQVVRTRGWFNVIRAAHRDSSSELRARDVAYAYLTGSALNSLLPARGGDFLKLFMVKRRVPNARYSTLAATFGPEAIPEAVFGTLLVVWALAHGFLPIPVTAGDLPTVDVSLVMTHPLISAVVVVVGGGLVWLLARWARRRIRDLAARVKQGFAIMRTPRDFLLGVAGWQAAGRVIRLAGLACFMAAFSLPVTPQTALLVMAAEGAGRLVPIAPVSAGLRVAMLSYGFVEITDSSVDVANITSFWFAVGALHLVAALLIAIVCLSLSFGTRSPRKAWVLARAARAEAAPAPAPAPADA